MRHALMRAVAPEEAEAMAAAVVVASEAVARVGVPAEPVLAAIVALHSHGKQPSSTIASLESVLSMMPVVDN
ncbi:MAG: hypothetical protein SGPRY_002340 [Prymnesium sp.]